MTQRREPIPEAPWGDRLNQKLYARFGALKNKAKAKGIYFAWERYSQFLPDVINRAPEGYTPEDYSIRFNLSLELGYQADTMTFRPNHSRVRGMGVPSRTTLKEKTKRMTDAERLQLAADVCILLLTEEGDFDAIAQVAKDKVNERSTNR